MHYIVAPTHIRATHYAAALGLPAAEWRSVTTAHRIKGARGTFHLLPGCDVGAAEVAFSNVKISGGRLIDHG